MKTRDFVAVVLATFVLILLGDGVVASVVLGPRGGGGNYNWNTIAFGWAFAVAAAGLIVGADNNPAITLANAVRGVTPWSRVLPTFLGTFLGGFLGALAVYLVYRDGLVSAGLPNIWTSGAGAIYEPGSRTPAGSYSLLTASIAEFFGTLVLMWSVLAVGDRKNAAMAKAGPFVVGGVILAIGLCLGGPSGYSLESGPGPGAEDLRLPGRFPGPVRRHLLAGAAGAGPLPRLHRGDLSLRCLAQFGERWQPAPTPTAAPSGPEMPVLARRAVRGRGALPVLAGKDQEARHRPASEASTTSPGRRSPEVEDVSGQGRWIRTVLPASPGTQRQHESTAVPLGGITIQGLTPAMHYRNITI